MPVGAIADAERSLSSVAGSIAAAIKQRVGSYLDGGVEVIDARTAGQIRKALSSELEGGASDAQAGRILKAVFDSTDTFNARDVARSIGVRIPEFSSKVGDQWRREQVDRITGLEAESRERIIGYLEEVGERGMRVETLRKRLEENEEVGFRRARLVARDLVLTLNARLTESRHKAAGIEEYEWLAMSGGSTRQHHADLDGKRFRYDNPPMGGGTGPNDRGNPGDGIGCRCQAIPVVPEFEEEATEDPRPSRARRSQEEPEPAQEPETRPTQARRAKSSEPEVVSITGRGVHDLFVSTPDSMRDESFAFLRGGGSPSPMFPVTLTQYPDGQLRGTDGRHRITVARERGEKTIEGLLRVMGPRGGVKTRRITIKL